jgi:signal recognition particle GTPase
MGKHSESDIDGKIEKQEQNVEGTTEKEQKQTTAFEELVLPSGHKDMLLSLISQHFRDKESTTADEDQNDIVRGKGKGLIILLHGLPGVGKTTTAEVSHLLGAICPIVSCLKH